MNRIVIDGDSMVLSNGDWSEGSWPACVPAIKCSHSFADYLMLYSGFPNVEWCLVGTGGLTIEQLDQRSPNPVDTKHPSALLTWALTNDLYFGASADVAYTRCITYLNNRWRATPGLGPTNTMLMTVIPRLQPHVWEVTSNDFECRRAALNAMLRTNPPCELLDLAMQFPYTRDACTGDTQYYIDGTHPSDFGARFIGMFVASQPGFLRALRPLL